METIQIERRELTTAQLRELRADDWMNILAGRLIVHVYYNRVYAGDLVAPGFVATELPGEAVEVSDELL